MRILVTGGAGFIGSHYVRTLLAGGYPGFDDPAVTVLDKLTYAGNLANLDPVAGRYEFVHGDICDAAMLRDVLPGHDAVVNFAAETHVDRSIAGAAEFVTSNVVGVQVLLDACMGAGAERIVQVSTDEVYGSIATGSWTEASPPDPNSPYAATKAGGDLIALAYARTHRVNVSITRCCNNYGPYQYPERSSRCSPPTCSTAAPSRSTATGAMSAAGSTSTITAAASNWPSSAASRGGSTTLTATSNCPTAS
jgi:dTDP-glucose 4,6-dehydratase